MLTSEEYAGTNIFKQHWIKLTIAVALIIAYSIAGFVWVPKIIRSQAEGYVETQLHRHLALGEVTFNPFTLTADIHDIKLDEANAIPIARVKELLVNAEVSSLWQRAFVFKQVRIDSPAVNMIIDHDGNLNLAAIQPDQAAENTKSSPPPRIHITKFELLKGELKFIDRSRPQIFDTELKPITFTLQNFRTEHDHENAFHFAATSDEKESLDWRGDFTVAPFSASGTMKVLGLKASTIQSYLQDKLPFLLSTGSVDLDGKYTLSTEKQFDLALSLSTIHVSDAHVQPKNTDVATDWLVLPQVNVTDTAISLHDRSIGIGKIDIDDANAQIWLNEHHQLNLLQLLPEHSDDTGPKWNTHIAAINLNRATIHAEDRAVQPVAAFTLSSAQVQLQNFDTAPASQMNINAQININNDAQLTALGNIQLDTLSTSLQLNLNNFALVALQNYAAQSTDVLIHGGTISTEGILAYKGSVTGKEPLLLYTGAVEVNNLDTEDKATGGDFIKWKKLQLQSFRYAMAPDQLSIDKVIAHGLYGRMAIYSDSSTNVQHALRIPATKNSGNTTQNDQAPAKPASPALKIQIAKVVIEDSSADFSDESVTPNFATGIQSLNGDITGLSTNDNSRATVNLKGSVDNYAPANIKGEINFLSASAFSNISMDFRNIDLTTFNPYSGKFAGYNIEKGKLATNLHYSIVDRKLDAQHHIVVDQLEFGKATESKDAVSLPIKLAVALLKDRNGVIEIDLPVSGSLDDPEFHAGSVIWKALRNLLGKIVTSPFAALGSLFGGSEEMAFVDFAPGSKVLADTEKEKLNKLSHAMVERPQLKLDVPLNAVADADVKVMSKAAFDKAVAKHVDISSATPQQHLDALIAVFKEKTGNLPEFSPVKDKKTDVIASQVAALEKQLLPMFAPADDERYDLAAERAEAVEAALLSNSELSADRVFKINSDYTNKSSTSVRLELKLE